MEHDKQTKQISSNVEDIIDIEELQQSATHTDGVHNVNLDVLRKTCKEKQLKCIPFILACPEGVVKDGNVINEDTFIVNAVLIDEYGNRICMHSNLFKPITK